ncbi:MAG: 3-oxoacyl-[acyl-carrier-protein] reductase FabG [bacterium]|nr:3-oxoacyl-[acyl-carrier-protein] reductase FabG [bacterium]
MFDLSGKTALVTGASRGIGSGVARRLAAAGAFVWVHYNASRDSADALAAEIRTNGGKAEVIGGNVAQPEAVEAMFATIEAQAPVDILVNNAGINIEQHLVRMSDEEIQAVLSTNLFGTIYCTRRALPNMRKARWGRLVHMSSIVANLGSPMQTIYCTSKSALFGFSKALTKEYANRGITSNVIMPGLIDTDMTRAMPEEQLKAILAGIPAGRMGTTEDIAAAVHFLVSPEASFISGAEIAVNGGAL